jgi:rhodanese-related sulfurtransferase
VSETERTTIDDLLAAARARLERLSAPEAHAAMADGAVLVDIRSQDQRRADGVVPGARWFPRNVLEWRVDPASPNSHAAVNDPGRWIVLLCAQGFQTSLAAATLHDLGFARATDVVDGFDGWRAAGLPIEPFDEARDAREG